MYTDLKNKYAHYKNVERKSPSSVRNIQYQLSKPTNIVTTSRKSQKSAKILKIFVGKQSVETMYLWVSPASHAQLCEFIAKPSRAWKKRLHQSGRANYRGSAEVFLPGAPTHQPNPTNQPNHPTIHLNHHSTHSFQDVANLLLRYFIQNLKHSWAFMGSQATFFLWKWNVSQ